jgi:hypothetical protein
MWLAGTILARGLWPACLHAYMRIHAYRPQLPQCNMLASAHRGWCTAPCWQALTSRYWHVSVRSLGRCARQHAYMRIQACCRGSLSRVSVTPTRVPGGWGRGPHSAQRSLYFTGKFCRPQKFFAKKWLLGIETDPKRALLWCAPCTGCTGRTGLNPLTYSLFFFMSEKEKE